MQAHLSAAFILSVSVLCGVWAQVPFPGQCPEVKIMDTFDLEAYMGIWYEYSKYPFAFEIGKKCMYANYTLIDNSTVSVVNAAINRFTNNPSNVSGIAKVIAPAQLVVVFSKNQHATKPNYLVLSTDYDSYAVVYSCTNVTTLAHLKLVWILTRERLPAKQTISAALQVLDDNRINQALLIDTLQTNCPNLDNSSAYGNETTLDLEEEFVNNVLPNAIEKV